MQEPLFFSSWFRTLACLSALGSTTSSAMTGTSSPRSSLTSASLSDSAHKRASFSYVGK